MHADSHEAQCQAVQGHGAALQEKHYTGAPLFESVLVEMA